MTLADQCVKRVLLSRASQDQERSHQRQQNAVARSIRPRSRGALLASWLEWGDGIPNRRVSAAEHEPVSHRRRRGSLLHWSYFSFLAKLAVSKCDLAFIRAVCRRLSLFGNSILRRERKRLSGDALRLISDLRSSLVKGGVKIMWKIIDLC